jgi:hypothetical protein
LEALDASGIKYLIVGGVAVGLYAEPRYTKDIDVAVILEPPQHEALFALLTAFGAPTHLVTPEDFLQDDFVFYFGAPPWRVDILTSIPGVDLRQAFESRTRLSLGNVEANIISLEWLITAKRASGRPQDLLDAQNLEELKTDSPG